MGIRRSESKTHLRYGMRQIIMKNNIGNMKYIYNFIAFLAILFISNTMIAQQSVTDSIAQAQKDSIQTAQYWAVREALWKHYEDSVKESQKQYIGKYKLYKTLNNWTFLELDTQTGKIWQVQFSTQGPDYRYKTILDNTTKISSFDLPISGRFELYGTENIYNFVLLDRIDGRCWQIQWSQNKEFRNSWRIY